MEIDLSLTDFQLSPETTNILYIYSLDYVSDKPIELFTFS